MTHLLVIAIMVTAALRDLAPGPLMDGAWAREHAGLALGAALAPFLALIALDGAVSWRCARRLDRAGDPRALSVHERFAALVRAATAPLHMSAVLVFGWLDMVRGLTGDLVAVDEVVAALPPVAVLLVSWALTEPIERRVREALFFRRVDEGLTIPPMPRPWEWWWGLVRQQLLFAAVPVTAILAWSEAVAHVRDALWERMLARGGWEASPPAWTEGAPAWALDRDLLSYGSAGLQLAGVIALLAMLPIALRFLWDTAPLGPGSLRERLGELCAHYRIRVRGILVWRTHGAMINGAVVGFIPRLRYIVLTDTLLESLPGLQVEAVAAHEIAHVKHRHIPWLAGSMLAAGVFVGSAASLALRVAGVGLEAEGWAPVAMLVAAFGVGILLFGWASRRFEWQADAFAAKHLTVHAVPPASTGALSELGARCMSDALRAVALINGFPSDRFTWRHGSIDDRRRRLAGAVGQPLARLPADRAARRVKAVIALVLVAGIALAAIEAAASSYGG